MPDSPRNESASTTNDDDDDDMLDEYDFDAMGPPEVGKYFELFQHGKSVVILDPDLSAEFPDSASVNRALRRVVRERRKRAKPTARVSGSPKT